MVRESIAAEFDEQHEHASAGVYDKGSQKYTTTSTLVASANYERPVNS